MAYSNRIRIIDEDGNEIDVIEGFRGKISVVDDSSEGLLEQILIEMKKINTHLSIMNDMYLKDEDVIN